MEKGTFIYVALGLLVWAISSSLVAGYYINQYNIYHSEYSDLAEMLDAVSIKVNILLGYGNDTTIWRNNTVLPLNSTAFTAAEAIADIEYTDYGGELGILITSINGIANNETRGWLYWHWETAKSMWVIPEYSSAKFLLHRDDTIAFTYVEYATWPPPPPT
jgi:hypothetical protein